MDERFMEISKEEIEEYEKIYLRYIESAKLLERLRRQMFTIVRHGWHFELKTSEFSCEMKF